MPQPKLEGLGLWILVMLLVLVPLVLELTILEH
jgi:hypothetical protein